MVFNSLEFFVFMIAIAIGVLVFRHRPRLIFLTIASYVFYSAYRADLCLLLATSTLVDWFVGRRLHRATATAARRFWLLCSLVVNLGLLATFKYGSFATSNLNELAALLGIHANLPEFDLVLPPGISFYTFQTLSYTIDIYRRKIEPYPSFWGFTMYVAFFPQLVAGPIVRAREFLPQIGSAKPFDYTNTLIGIELVLFGLFKKMVIADGVAPAVDTIYHPAVTPKLPGLFAAFGTFLFAVQIYCDFSGYTDIARGVARWLGYDIPKNFAWPYLSASPQEFWRRWHQTLSFWFRDYLYISLGGSRRGTARTLFNLILTMGLAGLWHGASWLFVTWGLFYGVWLAVHRVYRGVAERVNWPTWRLLRWGYHLLAMMVTFTLVNVAWVFFRAPSFDAAGMIIWRSITAAPASIAARNESVPWNQALITLCDWSGLDFHVALLLALSIPVHCLFALFYEDGVFLRRCPRLLRPVFIAAFALVIMLFARQGQPFIYFAF